MPRNAQSSVATIEDFIATVGHTKVADAPLSEPGSIGGETTHPVKKVDDRLEKAKEGERSSENSKDVKADQGAPSVEGKPEASTKSASLVDIAGRFAKTATEGGAVSKPGSAEDDHLAVTTKVAPTGEDSANETGSAKAGKEDKKQGGMGGTSHPASTENNALDGHKYASDTPLEKLAGDMQALGNNLLASLHNVYTGSGQQAPQQTKTAAASNPQPAQNAIDPNLAYMVGNEMAGLISGNFDKQAADAMVKDTLASIIKEASDQADLFIDYARRFKQAEEAPPEEAGGGGGDPMGGGGAPPPGGGMGGGGEEEAMMAALGGGAGGGDPMGGGGAPPPGGGGDPMGGAGGGGGDEAAMLAQILETLGVSPEELQQAIAEQQAGGGGMGGPPPGGDPMGGGGAPPPGGGMGGPPPGGGMETQAGDRGGKPKVAAADVASYIQEVVGRSRTNRRK